MNDTSDCTVASASMEALYGEFELELIELTEALKPLAFCRNDQLLGRLGLALERSERLLAMLAERLDEQHPAAASEDGSHAQDPLAENNPWLSWKSAIDDSNQLFAKARGLLKSELVVASVEGNVVHLEKTQEPASSCSIDSMLRALEIDALLSESSDLADTYAVDSQSGLAPTLKLIKGSVED